MAHEQEKQEAARASLKFVKDGFVVGLGSGTTAAYAIRLLGEKVKSGLRIRGVPTSNHARQLAQESGIPLVDFSEVDQIDVDIDGADEFDPQLRLIKGGGGALLREKIVASASRQFVVVTDSSKQVDMLGRFPLPLEVVPFRETLVKKRIEKLGATPRLRQDATGHAFVTDGGHYILDCGFGQISDPERLLHTLKDIPGVVEVGLFIGMANVVLIARDGGITELKPAGSSG